MRSSRSDGSSRLPWRKNKSSRPKKRRRFGRREERQESESSSRSRQDSERYEDEYYEDEYASESRHADDRHERDEYEDDRYERERARGRRIDDRHDDRYEDEYDAGDRYEDERGYQDEEYEDEPRRKRRRFSLPKRKKKRAKSKRKSTSTGSRFSNLSNRTKYIAYGVGGLALLILFLPTLIGMTMGGSFLVSALEDVNGTVQVGGASMGWFSATTFYDVEIRDRSGETVLKTPELSSEKTAMSLYFDSSDLGKVRVSNPQAFIHFDQDGSNFEEVLAAWLEGPSTLNAPRLALEVRGGTVEIEDRRANAKWQFQDVMLGVDLERNWSEPMKLLAVAKMPQPDGVTDFDLQLTLDRRAGPSGLVRQQGSAEISTTDFPLAAFQPLMRRLVPQSNLQGITTLQQAKVTWGNISSPDWNMSIDGQLEARDLRMSAPALGGDEIYLRSVSMPVNLAYEDDKLTIERLASISDVGRVDLSGKVVIDIHEGFAAGLTQALADQAYEFQGNLDLAKLAAILPRTMHLRDGLQVTQGNVIWKLSHAGRVGAGAWTGHLEASQLRARRGEEVIAWDNPITFDFAAQETKGGFKIDNLHCHSDFIGLDAMGALNTLDPDTGYVDHLDIAGEFELDKLSQELNRFVDFGQTNFGGDGYCYLTWRRQPNGEFETTWDFNVAQFEVAMEGHAPWREDTLIIQGQANGLAQNKEITDLKSGRMELRSGVDSVQAEIINQIRRPSARTQWPLHVTVSGTTTSWLDRAQMWIEGASRWTGRTEGGLDIDAAIMVSPRQVSVETGSRVRLTNFVLETRNWKVVEPTVDATLAASWDPETDMINVAEMKIVSPTGEIVTREARIQWPTGGPPNVTGRANVTGDLTKIQAWRRIPAKHGMSGQFVGELTFANNNGATIANWTGRINDFSLQTGESATWNERLVRTVAKAKYDRRNDNLQIQQAVWDSNALTLNVSGDIGRFRTERELNVAGTVNYDPQKLVGLLKPYFGDAVRVNAARQPHPFRLQGVLTPTNSEFGTQLTGSFITRAIGDAEMSWTSADVFGFRTGAGQVSFSLAEGRVDMHPLDIEVNGGQLSLAGWLDLRAEQPMLEFEQGKRVLNNVTLTPDVARYGSLKYVVPWINGVTAAQGTFSLDVHGAHVPLNDPVNAEAAGNVIVHDIQFAPGPMLQQVGFWADLVRQLAGKSTRFSNLQTVRLMNESTVRYRVVNQRVYHRDLVLVFDDLTIKTQGWVGFDQTQAVLATIESDDLFPAGSVLAERGLQIPIGGTMSQPVIDINEVQKQMGGTAQSLLQRAAASGNRMLAEELERQLRKLLTPIR